MRGEPARDRLQRGRRRAGFRSACRLKIAVQPLQQEELGLGQGAAQRLKERGLKDFLFVFVGEDRGRTRYTGELWDLVVTTGTMDVIRMASPVPDMPSTWAL